MQILSNPDAVSDVIASLDVGGQVVLTESYQPPWAIRIPSGAQLAARLALSSDVSVVPFHMVRRGSFELTTSSGETMLVRAGEAVLCVRGEPHVMASGQLNSPTPFEDILDGTVETVGAGGFEGATELVCGIFALRNSRRNPLIQALPSLLLLGVDGSDGNRSLGVIADLLAQESQSPCAGSAFVSSRLVELFCAEIIRGYIAQDGEHHQAWIRGMADEKVGAALNLIHSELEADVDVGLLSKAVGMSSSRFAARFRDLMGVSPMKYVRSWRMTRAAQMLSDTDNSLADISISVGYENVSAFCRAFKAEIGQSPAIFRRT